MTLRMPTTVSPHARTLSVPEQRYLEARAAQLMPPSRADRAIG